MSGVVVDTSVWIDFFRGDGASLLPDALAQGSVLLPPIVVAELVSGASRAEDRRSIGELLQDIPMVETPLSHWIAVGELRRRLSEKRLTVSVPDAHVAQCAIDRDALLLTRDRVFEKIARLVPLRLMR